MHGTVAPGFEPLRDAFARNLREEAGAALCVLQDGRVVADLWGGQAAPGRTWQGDTLVTTFSATKGVSAAFALVEGAMYARLVPLGWRRGQLLGVAANAFGFGLGLVLSRIGRL